VAKTRIRRKDLKKPDEFVTQTGKAVEWISAHYQVVGGVVGGLLLLGAVFGVTSAFRSARSRDANTDLALAMASLRGSDLSNQALSGAATSLADVAQRWNSTPVAELASLLAANTEIRLGQNDGAITRLGELLAGTSDGLPSYLRQQALVAWGNALEGKADLATAATKYQAAADLGGPYTAQAVLYEARTREQLGEKDRATELYRKLYDQFPEFPDRELVRSKIDA
jgi:tetratricopeptide (TPR) repeat protein